MKAALLAPLRHRTFRLLFGGQLISDLGDWLDFLALIALIVYRWELGPSALAALSIAVALPFAVIASLSGVWADRLPRKGLMVAAALGRALVVCGLVFAPNLATVLALVFVRGVFSTCFGPARQATIAAVVPFCLLSVTIVVRYGCPNADGNFTRCSFPISLAHLADPAAFNRQ